MVTNDFIRVLRKRATITLTAEPEDIPIRGNVLCSGDDEIDRQAENDVQQDLDSGNECAWCCMHVKVSYLGLEANEYLGACSCKSLEDFKCHSGYYEEMIQSALEQLADHILLIKNLDITAICA